MKDNIENAKKIIEIEIKALQKLVSIIDDSFNQACNLVLKCTARVVVIGMGKSGHIASKIAATLASTGTPAFFVHPAEAAHGDFGMITKNDVVVAISNSGVTSEVTALIPMIKTLKVKMIAITSKVDSVLAKNSDITLNLGVENEACPHNLAPTCSTTTALVLGDALAIAISSARGFSSEDFAFSHPSGLLGKRLLLKVSDVMRSGNDIAKVLPTDTIEEAILEISKKSIGATFVIDNDSALLGVFTDGDLRRIFINNTFKVGNEISSYMTKTPKTISCERMAITALESMRTHKVTNIAVLNNLEQVVGIINMHDLVSHGLL